MPMIHEAGSFLWLEVDWPEWNRYHQQAQGVSAAGIRLHLPAHTTSLEAALRQIGISEARIVAARVPTQRGS